MSVESQNFNMAINRSTILVFLVCAELFAIPFALFASQVRTEGAVFFLFLILPILVGALAWLLINWRAVYELWGTEKQLVSLLLLALLITTASTAVGDIYVTLLIVLTTFFTALLWIAVNRIGPSGVVAFGIVLSVFLLVDALGLVGNHFVFNNTWLRGVYRLIGGLIAVLATATAGLCVYQALKQSPAIDRRSQLTYIVMAVILVLCVGLVTLRHGTLTNATSRAYEDHFPLGVFYSILIIGLVLILSLKDKARLAGLAFVIITLVFIVGSYTLGWLIDPQAVTAARAEGIDQAIQRYREKTGEYPPNLKVLAPGYLPILLGPLTGRGQVWCYQSGEDYYRLGYVIYERYHQYADVTPFWEPYYEIKVSSSAGQPPGTAWMCDEELENFKQNGGL